MSLNYKAVGINLGSIAAGAWGAIVFAQTNSVDLFALIAQLKKLAGDFSVTWTMLAPFMTAGIVAYRTYGMKQVPRDSVAVESHGGLDGPGNELGKVVGVTGKIVGALLLAALLFMPGHADAGPLDDKINQLKAVIIVDLTAARDDARANSDPAALCWDTLLFHANAMPPKLMGVAHTFQRARTLRRGLPAILDACAVVKDGARQALLQIFGAAAGGVAGLTALGL